MERRCGDPALQLDIDELILDYLIYSATKEIINDYGRRGELLKDVNTGSKADTLLQLVDTFLDVFHSMHLDNHGNPESNFRLQLLKFTVIFTKRTAPKEVLPSISTLQMLRKKRRAQANTFRFNDDAWARLELPDLATHLADPVKIKQEQMFQDEAPKLPHFHDAHESIQPPISLLDTLPLFMALSATQNAMQETTITQTWMQLAAGYMAQAVIEQYLVYGSRCPGVIQESFAWGFDAECGAEEGSEEWQVNAMFWDEEGAVPGWDPIRDEHIHALTPPEGVDLQQHLRTLIVGDLSIIKFEERVLEFMANVHQGQPRPWLAQVEMGKVDGLSRREVRAVLGAIGMA